MNPDETLRFLDEIWDDMLEKAVNPPKMKAGGGGKRPTILHRYYDFSTLEYISPSAALILASLFQRTKHITGRKVFTVDEREWNPVVQLILRAVGFHELLDMRPLRDLKLRAGNLRILQFTSGQEAAGEPAGRLQEALSELLPDSLREEFLTAEPYGGMFEAILNSYNWAYPEDADLKYPILPNWWLTGAVDTKTNQVTVCAFDQGVSIPVSLPRWTHWGDFEYRGRRLAERLQITPPIEDPRNDGLAIQLAMKIARSKTSLPQHGKGLHTMVEVAERARHGRLRIISRNGEFVWETGRKPVANSYSRPLRGTLVEWQLQLLEKP